MILSRTMRPSDYQEFQPELDELNKTIAVAGPVPYTHRRWEYALVLKAVAEHFGTRQLSAADFGCETGLSPAMLLLSGHDVSLYEIWSWGNKEADARDKAQRAQAACLVGKPTYRLINRPLGGLLAEDKNIYDLALCISVMEHIQDEEGAFNDLLDSVKEKGMVLVTMDFAPSETDYFFYKELRARIYNQRKMESLVARAQSEGFELLGGQADWSWSPDRVMVEGQYGFSSLVLVKS